MLLEKRAKSTQPRKAPEPPRSRGRSARDVPPPKHAPQMPVASTAQRPAADPVAPAGPKVSTPASASTATAEEDLKRATVYLDEYAVETIDAVLAASKHMKPRVNSGSAVIRLALSRLAEQLSPQQTAEILRDRAAAQQSPGGRKRV